MKLIVGLGNPGKDYLNTRHNIGFMFVDNYLEYLNIQANWKEKFNGLYLLTKIKNQDVLFLKPQTFMNLSGNAVREFVNYYKIKAEDILVVHDDLDLEIGNFKLRQNGSSGGHNGIKNIIENIGTGEFKRLKIGISKNKQIDTKDYVLGKIRNEDKETYDKLFKDLNIVIDEYFDISFGDLMSKYNRKNR